jgi:hypothetical protein
VVSLDRLRNGYSLLVWKDNISNPPIVARRVIKGPSYVSTVLGRGIHAPLRLSPPATVTRHWSAIRDDNKPTRRPLSRHCSAALYRAVQSGEAHCGSEVTKEQRVRRLACSGVATAATCGPCAQWPSPFQSRPRAPAVSANIRRPSPPIYLCSARIPRERGGKITSDTA